MFSDVQRDKRHKTGQEQAGLFETYYSCAILSNYFSTITLLTISLCLFTYYLGLWLQYLFRGGIKWKTKNTTLSEQLQNLIEES